VAYHFVGGEFLPVTQFEEGNRWIAKYAHQDGFLYPPIYKFKDKKGKLIPNSERPAHLHRVPASHNLQLDLSVLPEDRQRAHASFIMHLIAYLHGTRLQFEDWWLDARIPLEATHNILFASKTAEHFISYAYKKWQRWPWTVRKRFTNILYMLNRAPSYEWDWEHFVVEYMVLDACWRTAADLKLTPTKRVHHAEQIDVLCGIFKIERKTDLAKEIVRLRNDLFHEALWDGGHPGNAANSGAFFSPLHLRRFNQRLVLALLGYDNPYMRSGWWSMGRFSFEILKTK
jgi:hypothetical protein